MTERNDRVEREVIVTNGQGSGGGGMIVAVIIGILGILLAIWLFTNLGGGDGEVIPDEVNISVDDATGGGGDDGGGEGGEG